MKLEEHKEYGEVIEAILKATGNFEIFKDFEEKLSKRQTNPEQLRQNVIILTSLAEAVKDEKLKNILYQKIIEELVLHIFNVEIK